MLSEFIGNVNPVEAGQIFVIGGKTIDAASRFDLNFKSGKTDDDDIIFQLSVRFNEQIVIRNTCHQGAWGESEVGDNLINSDVKNPLVSGELFKFYILVGDSKFHVAINNHPFCTYKFRIPVEEIRTVHLHYDLQVLTQMDHRSIYPRPIPAIQCDDTKIVFSNDVPELFKPGHLMIITGIPYGNPKGWFYFQFTEGAGRKQALHISVRFDPYFVVIRNSMSENSIFGEEEKYGGFPFAINQQFKMVVALTDKEFRIAVNGEYHSSFQYRTFNQLDKMNGFKIGVSYGMQMEITSVDHLSLGPSGCDGFESYSFPNTTVF